MTRTMARLKALMTRGSLVLRRAKAAAIVLVLVTLAGCAEPKPRLLIINQPMAPIRLIHEGTPGWWLSDALYEATLLKLEELHDD